MSEKEVTVGSVVLGGPGGEDKGALVERPHLMAGEVFVAPLKKRIEKLEYTISALVLAREQEAISDEAKDEPEKEWKPTYRLHNPEFKDGALRISVQRRGDGGHVYETAYTIEIWDNKVDPPELRIRRV